MVVEITLRKAKKRQDLLRSQVLGREAQPALLAGGRLAGGPIQQVQNCASETPWAGPRAPGRDGTQSLEGISLLCLDVPGSQTGEGQRGTW